MQRIPLITPETRHFWDGLQRNEFLLQQCGACRQIYFPPRPFCHHCMSRDIAIIPASGRGSLYSYVISHRPPEGWPPTPFSIALVTLEEGPRVISNIVDCAQDPATLQLDMPLEMLFRRSAGDFILPVFRPARPQVP